MKVAETECNKRSHKVKGSRDHKEKERSRCRKYFTTLVEKGKDVKEFIERQKLKRDENKQNVKLEKRLDLLEEKTESELHTNCTTAHFNFCLEAHCWNMCIVSKIQRTHTHMF